jgi:hypothetical protein
MNDGPDLSYQPPDENEAFANLDESLDDVDVTRPGSGSEGGRDLDTDLIVDRTELEEAGADLDDPERLALLDGGMDDPDGSGPKPRPDDEAGWDVDPVTHPGSAVGVATDVGADGDAVSDDELVDVPDIDDPDVMDVPPEELDASEDIPGIDTGR